MSDARQTRYDRRRRSCRTNSEFDSIRGKYRFFECRKTGSQTESKNRFIRFFPYRYTTLVLTEQNTWHEMNKAPCTSTDVEDCTVLYTNTDSYLIKRDEFLLLVEDKKEVNSTHRNIIKKKHRVE